MGLDNGSPPGLAHDEVANWLIDRSILAGNHAVYFTRAYGHEAGFHYVQTGFISLLGDSAFALRLPAALAGVLGIAVCYALVQRLFGWETAVIAAALCATLFWPVFYSRLALRAIFLPVTAGLSAYFWWAAWEERQGDRARGRQSDSPPRPLAKQPQVASPPRFFILSALFAALSVNIYLAARALPIFYALWFVYLAISDWRGFRARVWEIVWFTAVFAALSAPLYLFLQNNPGAEFRVEEVSYPLQQLRDGNVQPMLENGLKIAGMFAFEGDPLWRQNVAFVPVFEPIVGILFYLGLFFVILRWKRPKFAFVLLWTAVSITPSLATINAPSTIRMVLLLPLLTAFPAIVIHAFPNLSTVFPNLSTVLGKSRGFLLLTILIVYGARSIWLTFAVWPNGGDIPFVWQAAFTEISTLIEGDTHTAIGGWSPDTMDSQTMALLFNNAPPALSYFNPQDGTLIVPNGRENRAVHIHIPTALDAPPSLLALNPQIDTFTHTTRYTVPPLAPSPPRPLAQFRDQIALTAVLTQSTQLQTQWHTLTPQQQPMRVFVQALNEAGEVVAEDYHWDNLDPQGLWFPHWQADVTIIQAHTFPLTDEIVSLRIGIFDPYSCDPTPCQNLLTQNGEAFYLFSLTNK